MSKEVLKIELKKCPELNEFDVWLLKHHGIKLTGTYKMSVWEKIKTRADCQTIGLWSVACLFVTYINYF